MRIVQINAVYNRGSTGYIVQAIDKVLRQNNEQSWIAYAEGPSGLSNGIKIGTTIDHKIHALLSRIFGMQGNYSLIATKKLIKKLEMIEPDVVHLHNLHHNYINIELLFEYLSDHHIKTVFTLHDCWFFTGKCTHFQIVQCNKWITGCHSCPQLIKDNPSWIFDYSRTAWNQKDRLYKSLFSAYVVGASYWISKLASESILKAFPITTIHNGIDTQIFTPEGDNLKSIYKLEDKFIVLVMGSKIYSPENFGLAGYLAEKIPPKSIIIILGAEKKKDENKSDTIIHLPAATTPEEMARIYRTADVFLNVTHEDTLPTVNLEAMACGTPVVTYSVGGCPETLGLNTGIIVKENDWDNIVNAIQEVKLKGKSCYSKQCVKHIKENYEYKKCFNQYLKVYKGELL